ncbi:dihydrolipoyl dehydrogenase family protein [Lentisalinibacter sediminis]|uniref:dihydrolipoyl dehydrogenase family protein n=1 Tax=Lentisalinibacter sediminis TaxID=2992237 RepID=UPI00386449C6
MNGYPGAAADREWKSLVFPEDYRNPAPAERYHLVVLGAGPGGLVTAIGAAGLGARVALVERHAMGGDCLNAGCVPSKALLAMAKRRRASGGEQPDFDDAFAWLRSVRAGIAHHDSVERYSEAGVDVFLGEARMVDGHTVAVGDERLRARSVVIATGSRAAMPAIDGLAEAEPLTNETFFDQRAQPRRLAILGAGAVGSELAQAMALLGTEVHLFEAADRPLPAEIPAAGELVAARLREDGVHCHFGAAVESVRRQDGTVTVRAGEITAEADAVLVALGRRPNVEGLELEAAGVDYDARDGIRIDERLRTSNRAVYAIGDVASQQRYTSNADRQARVVIRNALFPGSGSMDARHVTRCVYTQPEVAHVGAEESRLAEDGFDVYEVEWSELDRGQATGDTAGFARVLTEKGGDRILSATLVGSDAGEQIAPLSILVARGEGLGALDPAVFAYPTRAEYLRRLADAYNRSRLTPFVARLFRLWLRLRR